MVLAAMAMLTGCSASAEDSSAGAEAPMPANAEGLDQPAAYQAEESAGAPAGDRSVIITGAMYMTVEDPIAAADQAAAIVAKAGGRIDARSEVAADEYNGGSASLTLRIPSDRLDAAVDDLGKLGDVDQYSTTSQDVTNQVTDLKSQISTLKASTERIRGLLADAKDMTDIITLENELDGRQANLESLEAQQRGLDDLVSMSTIELSLTTEPVVIVEVDDSPNNFWDGLVSGWNGLMGFLSVALIVIGVLLPWLVLGALITVGIVAATRARRSRSDRKRAAWMAAAQAAPAPAPAPPAAPKTPAR